MAEPLRGKAIRELFDRHVPEPFVAGLIPRTSADYSLASDYCKANLSEEASRGTIGHLKRSFLHDMLSVLARQHNVGFAWHPNALGTDWHVEFEIGPVVFTVAAVDSPNAMPRDAEYRETLAASAQFRFPGTAWRDDEARLTDDSRLYAIIIHGRMDDLFSPPSFVNVAFPDSKCSAYLDSIALFDRYGDLPEVKQIEEVRRQLVFERIQKQQRRMG